MITYKLFCSERNDILFSIDASISILYTTNSFFDHIYNYIVINYKNNTTTISIAANTNAYDQIKTIRRFYKLAIYSYANNELKLAKKQFVQAIKPILCKPTLRTLNISYLSCITPELLDSLYHIALIYQNNKTKKYNYIISAGIFQYCAKFSSNTFFVQQANLSELLF